MLARFWHTWQARARLARKVKSEPSRHYFSPHLQLPECSPAKHAGQSPLAPYQHLSQIWHAYAGDGILDYANFLYYFCKARELPLESILDLACGTGSQTIRLAEVAPQVIGLDQSEAMLAEARRYLAGISRVQVKLGDFCNFRLDESFDIAICAGNSLNYVRHAADLHAVFHSVAQHLRPHGLFCFDTTTSSQMLATTRLYLHCRARQDWFAMRFEYIPKLRREVALVLLPTGLEIHHRIPIDLADVQHAAVGSGLELDHCWPRRRLPWPRRVQPYFFVMRKSRP